MTTYYTTYTSSPESIILSDYSVSTPVYTNNNSYLVTENYLNSPKPTYVINNPASNKVILDSDYVTSVNYTDYTVPATGTYQNLNTDRDVVEKIVNYIYFKFLDKWLYHDLKHILKYLVEVNGKITIIRNKKDIKSNKTNSSKLAERKTDYIEKHVFSKKDMYKLLYKLVHEYNVNWYDLPQKTDLVQTVLQSKLKKILKRSL
jgi:hypothetical protein